MNDDDRLEDINRKLIDIEEQLETLRTLKRKLVAEKEKLTDRRNFEKSEKLSKNEWQKETFSWSGKVREVLKNSFGIENFRSMQLETVNATLSKHDLILVAPTGGGKSLTYQLPALVDRGITLVVSPLISLMEDQVNSLENRKKCKIPAKMLSAQSTKEETKAIYAILEDPSFSTSDKMKLLYITPERMNKSKRFMQALQRCYQNSKLDRIAIDEVHSVSILGHDFRPDYKFLGNMKTLFPNTPILGVTATASRKVLIDIQKILNIRGCIIFNSPFNRPNLYYHVIDKPSENEAVYDMLADFLSNRYKEQSGIIYTFSIKDTETITSELLQRGIKVRPYHAQLDATQRTKIYKSWMDNKIQAVVATIAFGLGIDKPDVRFIIHHTISKSMENFYQESGRCGRDGKYAESILMYRMADMFKISSMTFAEADGLKNAYSMIKYSINSKRCRRDQFSEHFTEVWNDKDCEKMCDCCFYKNENRIVKAPNIDIMEHYRTILKILDKAKKTETKLTALKLVDAWFQKGPKAARVEDISVPNIDRFYGEQILVYLIINDYLREDFHYTAYTTISYIVQGARVPNQNDFNFNPSRIYDLPPIDKLKTYYENVCDSKQSIRKSALNYRDSPSGYSKSSSNFRATSNYDRRYNSDYKNNDRRDSKPSSSHSFSGQSSRYSNDNKYHNGTHSTSSYDNKKSYDYNNSSRNQSTSNYSHSSSSHREYYSGRHRNESTSNDNRKRKYSEDYHESKPHSLAKISSTVKTDDEDDVIIVETNKQAVVID